MTGCFATLEPEPVELGMSTSFGLRVSSSRATPSLSVGIQLLFALSAYPNIHVRRRSDHSAPISAVQQFDLQGLSSKGPSGQQKSCKELEQSEANGYLPLSDYHRRVSVPRSACIAGGDECTNQVVQYSESKRKVTDPGPGRNDRSTVRAVL